MVLLDIGTASISGQKLPGNREGVKYIIPKLLLDPVTSAGSATNGGTYTSANLDTFGARYVEIDISATTQAASTQAGSPSAITLQMSDVTNASSFVAVTGFRGGSATATNIDFVIPIGKTTGANLYKLRVDMRARQRYLNVAITPTTTQSFYVNANAFDILQGPITPATAGVLALIEG